MQCPFDGYNHIAPVGLEGVPIVLIYGVSSYSALNESLVQYNSPYDNVILFTDHVMLPVAIPQRYLSPDEPDIPGVSLPDLQVKTWLRKGNSW